MLSDRGIFIVADGMGGHAAGEGGERDGRAHRLARDRLDPRVWTEQQVGERLRASIRVANDAIYERTLAEHDKRGMGTTATVPALMRGRYLIGLVGDSRAYLLPRRVFSASSPKTIPTCRSRWTLDCSRRSRRGFTPTATSSPVASGASVDVIPDLYFGSLKSGRHHAGRVRRPDRNAGGRATGRRSWRRKVTRRAGWQQDDRSRPTGEADSKASRRVGHHKERLKEEAEKRKEALEKAKDALEDDDGD